MSAAVEPATVLLPLPSPGAGEGRGEGFADLDRDDARAMPGELICHLPGLGEDALVRVERARSRRDPARSDALMFTVEGDTWWTHPFGAGERIIRLGTLPDLDGDHVAEVRAAYLSPRAVGVFTRIVSGRTGIALLDLGPEHRATMWPEADGGAFPSNWPDSVALRSLLRRIGGDSPEVRRLIAALRDESPDPRGGREQSRSSPEAHEGRPSFERLRRDAPTAPVLGPTQPTVTLRRAVFSNSHQVIRDRAPQIPYPREWLDANLDGDADDWVQTIATPFAGDIRAPLCYTINQPITVNSVEFAVSPAWGLGVSLNGKVAKGRLQGGYEAFSSTMLAYNGNGTIITATNVTGFAGTMTTIARIADYAIDWRIDVTGTLVSYPAGTSRNHVHWVLLPPTGSFTLFDSLIDIGCRQAHGQDGSSEVAIADAIFGEFSDRIVYRATDVLEGFSPVGLRYFGDWRTPNIYVSELLTFGDAQCAAWTRFFEWCMFAVGIDPVDERLHVSYQSQNIQGATGHLVLPDWHVVSGLHTPPPFNAVHPHLNVPDSPGVTINPATGQGTHHWLFAGVSDQPGDPSQGITDDPPSTFNIHYVTTVDGKVYDPSFGNPYTSFDDFETRAFWGYALDFSTRNAPFVVNEMNVLADLNDDGQVTDVYVDVPAFIIRENPPGNDLTVVPINIPR